MIKLLLIITTFPDSVWPSHWNIPSTSDSLTSANDTTKSYNHADLKFYRQFNTPFLKPCTSIQSISKLGTFYLHKVFHIFNLPSIPAAYTSVQTLITFLPYAL